MRDNGDGVDGKQKGGIIALGKKGTREEKRAQSGVHECIFRNATTKPCISLQGRVGPNRQAGVAAERLSGKAAESEVKKRIVLRWADDMEFRRGSVLETGDGSLLQGRDE